MAVGKGLGGKWRHTIPSGLFDVWRTCQPATRIAHLSDVHFGKISHPAIVGSLVRRSERGGVDLVAVSGDLTQRARRREFPEAKGMLDPFDPPVIVVPGNHDVRAWWHNPFDRVYPRPTASAR